MSARKFCFLTTRHLVRANMSSLSGVQNRGLFVVLEGCDCCGKSTQSRLLTEFFERQNLPVKHLVFPARDSDIGKVIDAYLRCKQELSDQAIHLLFSANRWESMNSMRKLLESGVSLIVDRYSYSGVAYSVAKGLPYDWCMAPEKGLLRPDIVFYLNASVESLAQRGSYGKERYEKKEFQQNVANVFDRIYNTEKEYWHKVDASKMAENVFDEISTIALRRFNELKGEPLETLK